ncbi:MAG: CsbD family protein [Pseudomonadota bacterium]|nr:CsbD family protein [Pseudomonadota bacterium]
MQDLKEHTTNRNQVKGAAKNVAGKVQQKVGELTGNRTQQAKGAAKRVEGKVQKGVGNVEQALDKAYRKTR